MPKLKASPEAADPKANGKQEPEAPQTFTAKEEAPQKVRKVVYPDITVNGVKIDPAKLRVSVALAKKILGWETEAEWAARVKRADKTLAKVELTFANHDPIIEPLLTDENGDKVLCRNNRGNRPFNVETSRKYAQDMLNRNWAGSNNGGKVVLPLKDGGEAEFDEMTINGEPIIVGRSGEVESGQRRLVGLCLAAQIRAKNLAKWGKKWPEEPFIESLVVFGTSEHPNVVRTLDTQDPRTLADSIVTSPIFRDLATGAERKECARMLDAAVDLLWHRTGASETGDKYQSHSASFDFLARHKKLERCVREIFELNKSRAISYHAKLSPGASACCLYLMGSSGSDLDGYRTADPAPGEKKLSWDRWDLALGFFKALADKDNKPTRAVRVAIKKLIDSGNSRAQDKLTILAKSWNLWAEGQPIREADLELHYRQHEDKAPTLLDDDCFGGIDLGHKPSKQDDEEVTEEEAEKTKEEIEAEKKAARKRLAEELVSRRTSQDEAKPSAPATYDKDGKPPTAGLLKKSKPLTRKGVEAEQTRAAKEADAKAAPKKSGGVIVNAGNKKAVK